MKTAVRPVLTLPRRGLVDAGEDRLLPLAMHDVLLPCRKFRVEHKVAVLGRVSLTAEFLLRLLKSLDGMSEQDAASFFGFNRREMSYVVNEVSELGYVDRRDARLWLTMEGHSLFREGSAHPEIFEVEKRAETFAFDLLSVAPQPSRWLDDFELVLPELPVLDPSTVSSAASRVPQAFHRHYGELAGRRDPLGSLKQSIYSIDAVVPGDRFLSPVRMALVGSGLRPSLPEIDLNEWRPEHEQDQRAEVRSAAAAFKECLFISRRPDDRDAYEALLDLAPEFLKDFIRSDGLAVERYYREAYTRVGEPRADRPTVPLLGSVLLRDNLHRFLDVLTISGKTRRHTPRHMLWIIPQVSHWGTTSILPETLRLLSAHVLKVVTPQSGDKPMWTCMAVGQERSNPHLDRAFQNVVRTSSPILPRGVEILLVPGLAVVAAVHAPIGVTQGYPTPLGIISCDPRVLARAHEFVYGRGRHELPDHVAQEILADDWEVIAEAPGSAES